ncbi:MAG TPA: porin, partial [Nitrospiraceae bacterium]|nr:porin [Nitrospiraceae bacterium]
MIKSILLSAFIASVFSGTALAYDVDEKLSIDGTLTSVYQYVVYDEGGGEDRGRGALVLDIGLNYHPSDVDEFQVTLSYADGNALNTFVPFSFVPYADTLEDDLVGINGSNRDNLLEAWYKHTFRRSNTETLGITWGFIDASRYIAQNEFAGDEVSQFMNDAFVSNPSTTLPAYDMGGAAELLLTNFTLHVVGMSTKNDVDNSYNYYALQAGYRLMTALGEGNYRFMAFTTSEQFPASTGTGLEKRQGYGISFDQRLGDILGIFVRLGRQADDAIVDYDALNSGGLNVSGKLWGSVNDEIGIAYGRVEGADQSPLDHTTIAEVYLKVQVSERFDATLDVQ